LNNDDAINGDLKFIEEILIIILQCLKYFHNFIVSEHLTNIEDKVAYLSVIVSAKNDTKITPMPSARSMKESSNSYTRLRSKKKIGLRKVDFIRNFSKNLSIFR